MSKIWRQVILYHIKLFQFPLVKTIFNQFMDPFNLNKIKLIVKYLPIFQKNKMLMLPATSLNYWLSEVDILQEKLDILEEHISQLMSEIKKKNRIIQSYVMNIEPGALVSEESDIHKVGNCYFQFFWFISRLTLLSLYLTNSSNNDYLLSTQWHSW